jgi:hypothetical protein
MKRRLDIIGNRFGRLTVLECVGLNKCGGTIFLCECDCGNKKTISRSHIVSGDTRSCGCLRKDTDYHPNCILTCKRGHEYNEDNTGIYKHNGTRYCKVCKSITRKKWNMENPDKCRSHATARNGKGLKRWIKYQYGLSIEEYNSMLLSQEGKCDICRKALGDKINVDHDHNSLKVRALLCRFCNQGLGMFQDDIAIMKAAVAYLEKHQEIRELQNLL